MAGDCFSFQASIFATAAADYQNLHQRAISAGKIDSSNFSVCRMIVSRAVTPI
jgi:hypothetical protein